MTSKRKNFIAPQPIKLLSTPSPSESSPELLVGTCISYNGDTINFHEWLGRGIDDWVWACLNQLYIFLAGNTHTKATIFTLGRTVIPEFFKFLIFTKDKFLPTDIAPFNILQFISWLKSHPTWGENSRRMVYSLLKSLLLGMSRRGVVPLTKEAFPQRPFIRDTENIKRAQILSNSEQSRVAEAIRTDIIKIHHGTFQGDERDALAVYVLAIGMRTGMNTTPLLEIGRDAIEPHPFIPNMRILRSFKKRSNQINLKSLRKTKKKAELTSIPMDGVALFEKALESTELLSKQAPDEYKNHVWLYVKKIKTPNISHRIAPLSAPDLSKCISSFQKRHQLYGDDGEKLQLNMSRLRKTMENRLWRLSNGDLFTVAQIMGHQTRIADTSYLQVTPEMRRNATIVAEALPEIYKNIPEKQKSIEVEKTPVGSCKNSLFGDLAPGDGFNHCGDFMSCFKCRSYAVVGTLDDLHRLFSFYWFISDELQRTKSVEWKNEYAWTLSQIDAFTQKNFPNELVSQAKNLAQKDPHKFWKNYQTRQQDLGGKDVF